MPPSEVDRGSTRFNRCVDYRAAPVRIVQNAQSHAVFPPTLSEQMRRQPALAYRETLDIRLFGRRLPYTFKRPALLQRQLHEPSPAAGENKDLVSPGLSFEGVAGSLSNRFVGNC